MMLVGHAVIHLDILREVIDSPLEDHESCTLKGSTHVLAHNTLRRKIEFSTWPALLLFARPCCTMSERGN